MPKFNVVSVMSCLGVIFYLLSQSHAGRRSFSKYWGRSNTQQGNYNGPPSQGGSYRGSRYPGSNYRGPSAQVGNNPQGGNNQVPTSHSANFPQRGNPRPNYQGATYAGPTSSGRGYAGNNNRKVGTVPQPQPTGRTYREATQLPTTITSTSRSAPPSSGRVCNIDISRIAWAHGWLVDPLHKTIVYPTSGTIITLKTGEELMIICSGQRQNEEENYLTELKTNDGSKQKLAILRCINGEMKYLNLTIDESQYSCTIVPKTIMRKSNIRCYDDNLYLYKVGFWHPISTSAVWTNVYDICLDDTNPRIINSKFSINKIQRAVTNKQEYQKMTHRATVRFGSSLFPHLIDVRPFYYNANQRKTLSSQMSTDEYDAITMTGTFFHNIFNQGHLAPKSDFVYRAEMLSTFNYANTAPQWSIMNIGNMAIVEQEIRKLASSSGPITVYTGSDGNLRNLKTGANLYLNQDPPTDISIPIPEFFWKLVMLDNTNQGVVVICHNRNLNVTAVCPDVTYSIPWLFHAHGRKREATYKKDPTFGVCYSCAVPTFLNTNQRLLPGYRMRLSQASLLQVDV